MNKYKIVKQDANNTDQHICGFYASESDALSDIPSVMESWRSSKRDDFHVKKVDPRMILNPVATDYDHYIRSLIPDKEMRRVMMSDAAAEITSDFITCNSMRYFHLSEMIWKDWTVIDIGCSYNAESYLFTSHRCFIGVSPFRKSGGRGWYFEHFQADGTLFYDMIGQEFIEDVLPSLCLDLEKTFAICHFVPDDDCMRMVRETFPNCFVLYPK